MYVYKRQQEQPKPKLVAVIRSWGVAHSEVLFRRVYDNSANGSVTMRLCAGVLAADVGNLTLEDILSTEPWADSKYTAIYEGESIAIDF